jgi:hypothetical protein
MKLFDLSIWGERPILQNMIKYYLCEKNCGMAKFKLKKINGQIVTRVQSTDGFRWKACGWFENKISKIIRFQRQWKYLHNNISKKEYTLYKKMNQLKIELNKYKTQIRNIKKLIPDIKKTISIIES